MDGLQEVNNMLEKRDMRRMMPTVMKEPTRADPKLGALASKLQIADGKNPYYRGGLAIRNMEELDRNLEVFEHHEAPWVADWLEYLGDAETATRIRAEPGRFKKIIHERWAELRRQQ